MLIFTNKYLQAFFLHGSVAGLGLFNFMLLARLLSTDELGQWTIFLTVASFFEMCRGGLVLPALIRFTAGQKSISTHRYNAAGSFLALLVTLPLAVIVGTAMLVWQEISGNTTFQLVSVYFPIYFVVSLPMYDAIWKKQAKQLFNYVLLLRWVVFGGFFVFLLTIFITEKPLSVLNVVNAYIWFNVASSLLAIGIRWTDFSYLKYYKIKEIKKIVHFGKYSMLNMVAANLLKSTDTLLIGALMGTNAAAIYGVPLKIMEVGETVNRSFVANAFPDLVTAYYKNNTQQNSALFLEKFKSYLWKMLLIFMPLAIALIVFPEQIVAWIGGEKYASSAVILQMMGVYICLMPVEKLLGVGLESVSKPHLNLYRTCLMIVINIIADLLAIFVFDSIVLVAVVTTFTLIVGIAVGYVFLRKAVAEK